MLFIKLIVIYIYTIYIYIKIENIMEALSQ